MKNFNNTIPSSELEPTSLFLITNMDNIGKKIV